MVEPIVPDVEENQQEENVGESLEEKKNEVVEPILNEKELSVDSVSDNGLIQPMAFPTSNWGFNYQIDPASMDRGTYADFRTSYRTLFMPIYNNFVDHVAGRINDLQGDISRIYTSVDVINTLNKTQSNQIGYLQTTDTIQDGMIASISSTVSSFSSVDIVNSINHFRTYFTFDGKTITENIFDVKNSVNGMKTTLDNAITSMKTTLVTSMSGVESAVNTNRITLDNAITSMKTTLVTSISGVESAVNSNRTTLDNAITAMKNDIKLKLDITNSSLVDVKNAIDGQKSDFNKKIDLTNSLLVNLDNAITVLKTENISGFSKIKDYSIQFTALNANSLLNKTAVDTFSTKNAENLTLINATLKDLKNYDDTSFKKIFTDYFSSVSTNYESGIVSGDGLFVKVVKGQFTRLIAELNRQLTLSFTTSTNNIESFKTYLREEFALLNDWASLQVDWSKMINDNILIVIAALDKLVAKPSGDVNVSIPPNYIEIPVFDYDRLQKMLEDLSFGNVINEAGTNLWDVLQQLIDSLGGVVESIVGIVPDLIDRLIALIIPENSNFFSEDVESLTSAFDMKFDWAFNLSDSFQSIFSQPKSLSTLTIPIAGKEYKVVPTFVDLNLIKTILTGYFCFLTLFTSYKRIVGGGDVIQ